MNAEEFVEKLASLAPVLDDLLELGFGADEARTYLESFICVPRTTPLAIETHEDDALEFLRQWDPSAVEIGMFTFFAEPRLSGDGIEIGRLEVDVVKYRFDQRDFVLMDGDYLERMSCKVARDGGALLDALIAVAEFFNQTARGELDFDDEEACAPQKAKCVALLGGKEYEAFCTSFLGV